MDKSDAIVIVRVVGLIFSLIVGIFVSSYLGNEQLMRCYKDNAHRTATEAVVMCKGTR